MERVDTFTSQGRRIVERLLDGEKLDFTPTRLPDTPGIYVIAEEQTGDILRAGKTTKQTLRNRIYRNHLMGSPPGNLRAQLVRSGVCRDLKQASLWMREQCRVEVVPENEIDLDIRWAEHFLLAVLRPRLSD